MKSALRPAAGLVLAAGLCACATHPYRGWQAPPAAVEGVPFFPQQEYQCGPAALAMLLAHAGVAVTPEALVPMVWIPGRKGSLQAELQAATRRHGRVPLVLRPHPQALQQALSAGHPVLLFENLGTRWHPVWHYAVLTAIDPSAGEAVEHSGTRAAQRVPLRVLLNVWARAGSWAMVVADPRRPPPFAEARQWLEQAVAMAQAGDAALAEEMLQAAVQRWPREHRGWAILANLRLAAGDIRGALAAQRRAVALAPDDPAMGNNLAWLLGRLGCRDEALALARRALDAAGPGLREQVAHTLSELEAMAPGDCPAP